MKNAEKSSGNLIHLPVSSQPEEAAPGFGEVLTKYRKQADMSQQELADLMNTSRNTVTNWETGKCKPGFDQVKDLCALLGIPLHELFGISDAGMPTPHEFTVLRQYRRLSALSRSFVDTMVHEMLTKETDARNDYLRQNFMMLPFQATPAAAGPGCEFNNVPPEPMFVKKTVCSVKADAVIRVSGRSMEPLYCDGDLVYIKYCDTANEEDDVVCSTADGAVIKRLRNHKLHSMNPNLPYGAKSEDDHVHIVGRVLGIVGPDETPNADDSALLEELFGRDLREFEKKYGE